MKIAVFGSGGMLGRSVMDAIVHAGHVPVPVPHSECVVGDRSDALLAFGRYDFECAINCAGRRPGADAADMALANAAGAQLLGKVCALRGIRLVHVSTDCVYDDAPDDPDRRYDSALDVPRPTSLYGLTKLAGEPEYKTTLVVRTSFVGWDHGMLGWLVDSAKAKVPIIDGWRRAYWTGSTVDAVAEALVELAGATEVGLVHLATSEKISKYEVLHLARGALKLPIEIAAVDDPRLDRALKPDVLLRPFYAAIADYAAKWGARDDADRVSAP